MKNNVLIKNTSNFSNDLNQSIKMELPQTKIVIEKGTNKNTFKELNTSTELPTKLIQTKVPVKKVVDTNNLFSFLLIILVIIIFGLLLKFKTKQKFIPLATKEQYNQQSENLLNYYIENKQWNKIKEMINDSSYNKEIKDKARKILENEK